MKNQLSIVTVAFNSAKILPALLDEISTLEHDIIIINNSSEDNLVEIASRYSSVKIIENQNTGYGRGANIGFSHTHSKYVALINPDVRLEPNIFQKLIDVMESNEEIAVIAPRSYEYKNSKKLYQKSLSFDNNGLCFIDTVSGAFMLIRKDAFDSIVGFDNNIFLFFEENDLCRRLSKQGYKIAIHEHSEYEHEEGNSSGINATIRKIRAWHFAWSGCYFTEKHNGKCAAIKKAVRIILLNGIKAIIKTAAFQHYKATAHFYKLRGGFDFLIGKKAFDNDGKARYT